MKNIYAIISLMILSSFVLSGLAYMKVRKIDQIESFLVKVSQQPDGSSVYEQYLQGKLK